MTPKCTCRYAALHRNTGSPATVIRIGREVAIKPTMTDADGTIRCTWCKAELSKGLHVPDRAACVANADGLCPLTHG